MTFQVDLTGRLHNIDLRPAKALNPLFEALANSLHAIEDGKPRKGVVSIEIVRSPDAGQTNIFDASVDGFVIRDNGVGFTQPNFESFRLSDSTYKLDRGGKGIGRLLWLKAFSSISVVSTFIDSGRFMRREFTFSVPEGVRGGDAKELSEGEVGTEVRLLGMKQEFRERCPTLAQTIAQRTVEHFALIFLSQPPAVELIDGADRISLNSVRDDLFAHGGPSSSFAVGGSEFFIHHFHNHGTPERRDHYICLCVDGRAVRTESLRTVFPGAPTRRINDVETGAAFYYVGMVTGAALDQSMNPERTDFSLEDDDEPGLPGILTRGVLLKALGASVGAYLSPHLQPAREESRRVVERFVRAKAPQYHPILRDPDALSDLPPDLNDESKIDQYLRKIQFKKDLELSARAQQLQDKPISAENFESYKEEMMKFFDEENDYGKSALARYVVHRKVVIDLLDKMLGQDSSGEFPLEEVIHKLICPTRITSDDREYTKHNLWLVDERISFHGFLASNTTYREEDTKDRQAPDVMIFDVGLAFSDDDPPRSVVMLEFKRPQRDDYSSGKKKNPMDQVLEYVASLREHGWVDSKQRAIRVNESTQFYCYLICDLMPSLEHEAKKRDWTPTPDGEGYYSYNSNFKAYLEVISYRKLIRDSRMRNRALFKGLGLE